MKKVEVRSGQTMLDLAIQEYGTAEAGVQIAIQNGQSVTERLRGGDVRTLPDIYPDTTMQTFCINNDVKPATAEHSSLDKVFAEQFKDQFS